MSAQSPNPQPGGVKPALHWLRPKQWWAFGLGIVGLLIAADSFAFPLRDDSEWHLYLRFAWLLYAAVFFYRAYRPGKPFGT
jgi:hypothetical protein